MDNNRPEGDIRIDTSTPGTIQNGVESYPVRLTHLPTGLTVSGTDRSTYRLRKRLMIELKELVDEHYDHRASMGCK